ncbi:GAF and ANTAR domain-containing protein [Amycolatopsis sp. 195334CR]|uniref:GAF and ANTAR domain-containing protein n=1 Tax=Amycolatopsis sp. 195334CR TaxID=2814588 RepID=UPI001A9013A1|nr:GAF and ANTAR domain-containing protein [Amycolatopsis sp. 195334CR]MBN6038374.1 GAF and ANTAR domain-containing protein [Amycolatopsis sp. 195334CR]
MTTEQDWGQEKAEFTSYARHAEPTAAFFGEGLLAGQFAQLTHTLLAASTAHEVLERVVTASHGVVPGADLVSVTFRTEDGRYETPVETDPLATELDQLQYRTGEGPCLTAAEATGPGYIRTDDLGREPAWPEFGPQAADRGVSAVLSTTLLPGNPTSAPIAALNIYSRAAGALPANAHELALLLATHATLALARVDLRDQAELREAQLRRAIESRDVIGQAKGILMARRGCTAEEAFDVLRRTSQELNVKLGQLAETLTSRHSELDG